MKQTFRGIIPPVTTIVNVSSGAKLELDGIPPSPQRLAFIPLMFKLDSPFINVIKEAIKLNGLEISTAVLPPGKQLDGEKREELIQILKKASIL